MKTVKSIFLTLLTALFLQTNAQEVDLKKGLIGHYDFSDDAKDISGNGNDGILVKVNREEDVTGEKRGSYRFNNKKDHILLPIDINSISLPQVTLAAWVKPLNSRDRVIVLSNDDGGGDRKIFTVKKDKKRFWAISAGDGKSIGKTVTERDAWTFIVATYDNDANTASIYVNGEKTSGSTKIDRGSDQLYIGANPGGSEEFEALIDEVRVYNRILSDKEIDSLQNTIQAKPKEESKPKEHFYIVNAKLAAKSKPSPNASDLAVLEKGDTLHFTTTVNAVGGEYKEFLVLEIDGQTAYAQLKYLDKVYQEDADMTPLERYIDDKMDATTWTFWIIMVVLLAIGLLSSFYFGFIDKLIGTITKSDYEGTMAFFPLITGLAGFLIALPLIIWQDDVQYYIDNFSVWPVGYGFAAWVIWSLVLLVFLGFLFLLFESFTCGSIAHGIIRIVVQLILGVFTFISILAITIAVIIIAVFVAIALFFGGAMVANASRKEKIIYKYE